MGGSGRIYGMGGTPDNGCLSPAPPQPVPTVGSSRACSMMGKVSSQESQTVFLPWSPRTRASPHPPLLTSSLRHPPSSLQEVCCFSKQKKKKERKQLSNFAMSRLSLRIAQAAPTNLQGAFLELLGSESRPWLPQQAKLGNFPHYAKNNSGK